MKRNTWAKAALPLLLVGGAAHADFCGRTPGVVAFVEEFLGVSCQSIGPSELQRVKSMYMRKRGITSVQETDFSDMIGIEYLDFHGNLLIGLPGRVFRDLEGVLELHLSHNKIRSFPVGLFSALNGLEYLEVSGNLLTPKDKEQIQSEVPQGCVIYF